MLFRSLNPGSIVAIDRGHIDYALFARWSMAGVFFGQAATVRTGDLQPNNPLESIQDAWFQQAALHVA